MKPILTVEQRARALRILENVRESIAKEAGEDPLLEFALRRYVYVRLSYDERGNRCSGANSKSSSSTGSKGAIHCAAKHHDAIKSGA